MVSVNTGRDLKSRFLHVYSDLPIDLRTEIIVIINKSPITWNVAYAEIINDTELGKDILNKLAEMEMI